MLSIGQQKISIETKPGKVFIEPGESKQIVNADFLVTNDRADTLTLTKLALSVFDDKGNLIHSRFLDNNGTAPGIHLVPDRVWNGHSAKLLFSPFTEFSTSMPLHKLFYVFTFTDNNARETAMVAVISPLLYNYY